MLDVQESVKKMSVKRRERAKECIVGVQRCTAAAKC